MATSPAQRFTGEVAALARPIPPQAPVPVTSTDQFFHAMFKASWGGIALFASAFKTDNSRTQVVHDLISGDLHPVQDRGLRARRVHVSLLFDEFPGQGTPMEMFRKFKAAVDAGVVALFTHPVDGSYMASVGEFTYEIDEHSNITNASAEFIAEQQIVASAPVGVVTGFGSVTPHADILDNELIKIGGPVSHSLDQEKLSPLAQARRLANTRAGLSFGATEDISPAIGLNLQGGVDVNAGARAEAEARATANADASAAFGSRLSASASAAVSADIAAGAFGSLTIDAMSSVTSWSESEDGESVSPRLVVNDLARISDNIAVMVEVGGLESDLRLWPAYRAAILLGEAVRAAAIAALSEVASVFVMRVTMTVALLPLAAQIYGGAEAQKRSRQIARLNDIRSPAWLDPGDYLLPARPPAPRSPF